MNTPTPTRAPRALVAEDEPLLRMALCADLLKAWPGLQIVHQAAHGEDALTQSLALQPDLLFLDIRMPGMTGLEVAQALQEDWPANVPMPLISFVTAYADHALEAFRHGAIDYITKPWTPERLGQSLRQMKQRWNERCAWLEAGQADQGGSPRPPTEPEWVGQIAALLQGQAFNTPALATAERRDPGLIEALQKKIDVLEGRASAASLEGFYYKPRMDEEILRKHSEGIICLSGCPAGELAHALRAKNDVRAREIIAKYQSIFGKENFFLELMGHREVEHYEVLKEGVKRLSAELSIPIVATWDSHYLHKEDKEVTTPFSPSTPMAVKCTSTVIIISFPTKKPSNILKMFQMLSRILQKLLTW
jgi:CheY-like chemotaxis protein